MPDPEEVLTNVLADMFEPWEPASPRTIAFSKMLQAKLDERGIRLARVVPEDRPAPCPYCNDDGVVHTYDGIVIGPCDCVAGVPALDDDTRRDTEGDDIAMDAEEWAEALKSNVRNHVTVTNVTDTAELARLLDRVAAYLGGTE